jgi:hypothetical protein
MKKVILIVLAISLLVAGTAFATVVGSLHDLGTNGPIGSGNSGYGTSSGQVCVFCHHPHRGTVAGLTTAILWNITDWDETAFPVYDNTGSTMNATDGDTVINDGTANAYASYFCMACHDGTVGAGALVRAPRDGTNTTANTLSAATNLGTSLEDDHPVNFTYSLASGPDAEIVAIGSTVSGLGVPYPLFNGDTKMQCATCHDVHRGALVVGCAANNAYSCDPNIEFMLETTVNSEICIDCHVK